TRAPVIYGNRNARNVPRLNPQAPGRPANPAGVFDLPQAQALASAWLAQNVTVPDISSAPWVSPQPDDPAEAAAHVGDGSSVSRWHDEPEVMAVVGDVRRSISGLVVIMPVAPAFHARASVAGPLRMQVGGARVVAVPEVARVAVGDGHVLNAVTTEEKEVI